MNQPPPWTSAWMINQLVANLILISSWPQIIQMKGMDGGQYSSLPLYYFKANPREPITYL